MRTREIEESQWDVVLDQFSRVHHGQAVSVQSAGSDFGVQTNARHLPLLGITAERRGDGTREIQVMVGASPDALVTHVIGHPRRVQVAEWNDDVSGAVQIFAEDGTYTLVEAGPRGETLPPGYVVDDIIEHQRRPRGGNVDASA